MTKRLKIFLTALIGVICVCCFAAGCRVGKPGREEILKDYDIQVTYYANGGFFDKNTSFSVREVYFLGDSVPFFDVSEDTSDVSVSRSGYDFIGWYLPARYESGTHQGEVMYTYTGKIGSVTVTDVPAYPKLDANGEVVTDKHARPIFTVEGYDAEVEESNVTVVPSDEVVTSERMLSENDHLYVCAQWKPALKFVFKLSADSGDYVYGDNTYHPGDVIKETPFGRDQKANPGQTMDVAFDNTTFVANYFEETCENFAASYDRDDYAGESEIVVWSKFIPGKWTVVRNNPSKVKEMFGALNSSSKAFYVIEDVDCNGEKFFINNKVAAKIEGNGHKISNFAYDVTLGVGVDSAAPVFGNIAETASIKNLSLDAIKIKLTCRTSMSYFYAIFSGVEQGAVIENLKIGNVKAELTLPGTVANAADDDRSSWLFGGKSSDAEAITAYGITLTGSQTLTITK